MNNDWQEMQRENKSNIMHTQTKRWRKKRKQGHRHFSNEHDEEQSRERMRENYAALIGEELNQIQEQSRVMMREKHATLTEEGPHQIQEGSRKISLLSRY